jgi:hypothetical protein
VLVFLVRNGTQVGSHKNWLFACDLHATGLIPLRYVINHCYCPLSCIKVTCIFSCCGFTNIKANGTVTFLVKLGYVSKSMTFLISGTSHCCSHCSLAVDSPTQSSHFDVSGVNFLSLFGSSALCYGSFV